MKLWEKREALGERKGQEMVRLALARCERIEEKKRAARLARAAWRIEREIERERAAVVEARQEAMRRSLGLEIENARLRSQLFEVIKAYAKLLHEVERKPVAREAASESRKLLQLVAAGGRR